jgi:hypothetical protein
MPPVPYALWSQRQFDASPRATNPLPTSQSGAVCPALAAHPVPMHVVVSRGDRVLAVCCCGDTSLMLSAAQPGAGSLLRWWREYERAVLFGQAVEGSGVDEHLVR